MSLPPIPCAHCGTNFMRHTIDPEAPRLCNTCVIKDQQRNPPKGDNKMSKVQLLIECDRASQIEVEEICLNSGLSISQYFLNLHKLNTQEGWKVKDNLLSTELTPEMKEFHDEFESNAKEGKPQAQPVQVRQKKARGSKK